MVVDQQTRADIGHEDQTSSQTFGAVAKEKLKVKVANEVVRTKHLKAFILGDSIRGVLGKSQLGIQENYFVEEPVRRRWDWKNKEQLDKGPTKSGTLNVDSVEILNLND